MVLGNHSIMNSLLEENIVDVLFMKHVDEAWAHKLHMLSRTFSLGGNRKQKLGSAMSSKSLV